MPTTESLAAVVTDIRKIEMGHFPIPDASQTDAVLKVELCGICASDYSKASTAYLKKDSIRI
jgi:threonine dehydrogenase-like Zn-dependent dehydrogenase